MNGSRERWGGVKSFSNFRACSFLGYQIEWSFVKGHGVSEKIENLFYASI